MSVSALSFRESAYFPVTVMVGLTAGLISSMYYGTKAFPFSDEATERTINDRGERGTGTSFADKYADKTHEEMVVELYKTKAKNGLIIATALTSAFALYTFFDIEPRFSV
tara:strand:+ start:727 stop:1056 length:330 start_codon:yes stop_codon:yes gene_type:complete